MISDLFVPLMFVFLLKSVLNDTGSEFALWAKYGQYPASFNHRVSILVTAEKTGFIMIF
ncbi:protein of unknown function [Moritella yayanosii]|uniref:Uncharacterized protein n=1 Tax=Moritella yayanosii TaxID=69539 RepID=A0A330LIJ9_9GAMM|nr:protein of unknown function [Moritella yayanosii]